CARFLRLGDSPLPRPDPRRWAGHRHPPGGDPLSHDHSRGGGAGAPGQCPERGWRRIHPGDGGSGEDRRPGAAAGASFGPLGEGRRPPRWGYRDPLHRHPSGGKALRGTPDRRHRRAHRSPQDLAGQRAGDPLGRTQGPAAGGGSGLRGRRQRGDQEPSRPPRDRLPAGGRRLMAALATALATLGHWRLALREPHLPWLLALVLVLALTLESRTGVVNVLRGPVFLAVLFCLGRGDLRALWANGPARWFLLLMAWLGLSLLWDGASAADWKILQRGLQVLTLLVLVFLVARQRPDWQPRILRLYLVAGIAAAALVLVAWPGSPATLAALHPGVERSHFYTRGVLTISIFTGWMMAVLSIACAHGALATGARRAPLYLLGGLLCALVMLWTQARSAWLAAILGIAMVLWHHRPRRWWLWLAALPLLAAA